MNDTPMVWRSRLVHGASYLGVLEDESGNPCGFIAGERNDVSTSCRFSRKVDYITESVYWKLLFEPDGEWEDGFSPLDEIVQQLDTDRFLFRGISYHVIWVDHRIQRFLEKWIFG